MCRKRIAESETAAAAKKAEEERLKRIQKAYNTASETLSEAEKAFTEGKYENALKLCQSAEESYREANDFKDAAEQAKLCAKKYDEINTEWERVNAEKKAKRAAARKKRMKVCAVVIVFAALGFGAYKLFHVPQYDFPALGDQIVLSVGNTFDALRGSNAPAKECDAFCFIADDSGIVSANGSDLTADSEGITEVTFRQDFGGKKVKESRHEVIVLDRDRTFADCTFTAKEDGSYAVSGAYSGVLYYIDGRIYLSDDAAELSNGEVKRLNRYAENNGLNADSLSIAESVNGEKYIVCRSGESFGIAELDSVELVFGEWSDWAEKLPDGVEKGEDYDVDEKYQTADRLMASSSVSSGGCDSESEAIGEADSKMPSGISADSVSTWCGDDGSWYAKISYTYLSDNWSDWRDCSSAGDNTSNTKYRTLYRYRTIS